tara:strand:- start:3053 stop:9061 length:6009 start_codon:yes stop_codon:yes gene_type:complete
MFYKIGWILLSLIFVFSSFATSSANSDEFVIDTKRIEQLWQKVYKAEANKLPKTALKILSEILKRTQNKDALHGHYLKALCWEALNQAHIQGKKPVDKLNILRQKIDGLPKNQLAMARAIVAIWYWHYYQQNTWKFSRRSQTSGLENEDITTWDTPKLFRKIAALFAEAVQDKKHLQSLRTEDYVPIVTKGSLDWTFCESLYEFILRQKISFHKFGVNSLTKPSDAFEVDTRSPAFANLDQFLKFRPKTSDKQSQLLHLIESYQQLLSYLKVQNKKDVLVATEVERLQAMHQYGLGSDKTDILIKLYEELAETYAETTESTLALYQLAELHREKEELVKAMDICNRAIAAYGVSDGAQLCRNLQNQIMQSEYEVQIEHSVNSSNSELFISYRNVKKLYFRIYRENWSRLLDRKYSNLGDYLNDKQMRKILREEPVAQWNQVLEPTSDYKFRDQIIKLPKLTRGFYRVVVSGLPQFNARQNNKVVQAPFWFSDNVLLIRSRGAVIEGLLVDARDGKPVYKAQIEVYKKGNEGRYQKFLTLQTNQAGQFSHAKKGQRDYGSFTYHIKSPKTGEILWNQNMSFSHIPQRRTKSSVKFFTDRAIYRPGQTIKFKGIAYSSQHSTKNYNVLIGRNITVALRDANYQEIFRQSFVTNEFGSFSGLFTVPSNVLTGRMTLQASNPGGRTTVRVEQYKRPKFEVKIDKPVKQYRLDDEVEILGRATTFNGVSITNAKVKYRVVRQTRMPWWWRWHNPFTANREISFGEVLTDEEGAFQLKFMAVPDRKIDSTIKPSFEYQITVDVVDPTGETRSATESIRLGYTAIDARISVDNWLQANESFNLNISTKNLDGKRVDSKGKLTIYTLQQPQKPFRKPSKQRSIWLNKSSKSSKLDMSDHRNWRNGVKLNDFNIFTEGGSHDLALEFKAGAYRAVFKTFDKFDNEVESKLEFIIFDTQSDVFETRVPSFFRIRNKSLNAGESLEAIWASGYKNTKAFVSISQEHRILKQYWTDSTAGIHFIEFPVNDSHKGGFNLQIYFIQENQIYEYNQRIHVAYPEKNLKISWESFRSTLRPGQKELWTLKIRGSQAENLAAELVATLYDASLDSFLPHAFSDFNNTFWKAASTSKFRRNLYLKKLQTWFVNYYHSSRGINRSYPQFPWQIQQGFQHFFPEPVHRGMMMTKFGGVMEMAEMDGAAPDTGMSRTKLFKASRSRGKIMKKSVNVATSLATEGIAADQSATNNNTQFTARTNLAETAFFFPKLRSDDEGIVRLDFKIPEALTRWKFMAMAHGAQLESGLITDNVVTQKELMVQPNAPRFLRQSDELVFTAKISSLANQLIRGKSTLRLYNALTEEQISGNLIQSTQDLDFSLEKGKSITSKWRLKIPEINFPIRYQVKAKSTDFTDGEEGILPVLSNRILVRENKALWVRGNESREFAFTKLINSAKSDSLQHEKLVLQMTSNPSWYAVMALPYLSEYPYECSEQLFNRLYANQLASKITRDNPRIERIFEQWRGTDSLKSPLQKNQDLKSVLLAQTPWVLEAQNEEKARQNVGLFFDRNHLQNHLKQAFQNLAQRQLKNGAFSWFPGGQSNEFITLYIVTGFGRLRQLGVDVDISLAMKALAYLDEEINNRYLRILKKRNIDQNHLSPIVALYLYGRSFFHKEAEIAYPAALDFWMSQASKYWTKLNSRMSEAHIALGMYRLGDQRLANKILKSLRERALYSEEMGMYWGDEEFSYWWYRAPVETQSMMIELFSEFAENDKEIDDLKVWLIKQKQTQNWRTTKATSDAIYSLLLQGSNWLSNTELVDVHLGGELIQPEKIEAGTGFYEKRFNPGQIIADFGKIKLTKRDEGVAWGGLFWQYFEDIGKLTRHVGPLSLQKKLFVRRNTKSGPVIEPYESKQLESGDTLVVRIVLRADRDFEYVHLKDMRGAGTEPVNILSGYKYQDGLAYYESTKDTATHFFIDYLPKGTYVFEYDLKIFHSGEYQSGMAEIECMYAPEFNSHSRSFALKVK